MQTIPLGCAYECQGDTRIATGWFNDCRFRTDQAILFGLIYALLFALFIFLLDRKIRQGPVVETAAETSAKRYVPSDHKEY